MNTEEYSDEEKNVIALVRLNKLFPKMEITKHVRVGKLHITFEWRSRKNLWGRFGGGWNWKLGFQASGHTLILSLLVCSLTFYLKTKGDPK